MPFKTRPLIITDPPHKFSEVEDMKERFHENWLKEHELSDEKLLFHYTTAEGLKGILESKGLWFGHYNSFNDPLEIEYGKKIVLEILDEFKSKNEYESINQFYDTLIIGIKAFGITTHHAYISCFCESENLLSQWRGYSNKGGGYCIGFQFKADTRIKSNGDNFDNSGSPLLRKVIYDKEIQIKLVEAVVNNSVESILRVLKKIPDSKSNLVASQIAGDIANLLIDLILSFKHKAFEEEQEWRLLRVILNTYETDKLSFRNMNGSMIPYRETNIYSHTETDENIFPIKSIRFGPSLEEERTEASLNLFLRYLISINDSNEIKIPDDIEIMGPSMKLRS